jgi:hypothetical protein
MLSLQLTGWEVETLNHVTYSHVTFGTNRELMTWFFSFWAGFNAQVIYAQRYLDKERSPAKYRAFFLPWAWEKSNQFGTYRLLKRIRKASVHSHWSWHAVNILEYLVGNLIELTVPFVLWPHFSYTIAEDVLSINGPSLTIWFGSRKHSKYLPQHSP